MDAFRSKILSNSSRERVEVNQRDLIDKILARYSTEFVIYRELIQNSDDAESSSVKIEFGTENNKVKQILFKNDGLAFSTEDWSRLKYIAQGNPDEQKIGAFGVGFYSLFSVCENPFIYSNGQGMIFEWQENQLFTRQGTLERTDDNWTAFLFRMKEPTDLPDVEKFSRFLANSLGFMENLRKISVHFDNISVIELSKEVQESELVEITPDFDLFSPGKMFHLISVDVSDVKLNIKKSKISTNTNTKQSRSLKEKATICFKVAKGNVKANINEGFSERMKKIIKKKPPKETSIQMIFTEFNELISPENIDNSKSTSSISPVFRNLLPYPNQGKIHIGFSTNQTTGYYSHLAVRVIPTMERELIDFANETVAEYNDEMLRLAGTLCRILYENEMTQQLYNKNEKRAAHALTHFTFNSSTPNAQIGEIIESQFFKCKEILSILSTHGVLPISDVRVPNSRMVGFIKTIPVIPQTVFRQCETFFNKAKGMNLVRELTLQDVLEELEDRILSEDEVIKLLKWWISYNESLKLQGKSVDKREFEEFMQLACIDNRSQSLNAFRYSLNPFIIPPSVDVPADVLPYAISKEFGNKDLKEWLRLPELPLVTWACFIVNEPNLEVDPEFAENVHQILANSLSNISQNEKRTIHQLFKRKRCIPTTSGMMIPGEAYFKDVNILFPNLPTISFENSNTSYISNIMELLGVRKVVKLDHIIQKLSDQENCDYMQIVKYLALKFDDLKQDEIETLKRRPIWPKKDKNLVYSHTIQRFIISNLYTPSTEHYELGLPVIDLKERWFNSKTTEVKFLIKLGIQEYPTLKKILELAAHPTNPKIRDKALKYFIDNFEKFYSLIYNQNNTNIAFLPCSDSFTYAKPSECFIDTGCKIMNFPVIRQDLRFYVEKFGVRQHPDRVELLNRLIESLPRNENQAKQIFEYLATQQGWFIESDWRILSNLNFIPIQDNIYKNPYNCFFNIREKILTVFFSRIDFGERANVFLRNCGVKNEPSPTDFAKLLVRSSRELWNSIGDEEKYLDILKKISFNFDTITHESSLIAEMRRAPILVAIKKDEMSVTLASATEIYINDDITYQEIFNPLTAPENDVLETLYKNLGCKSLRDSVKETSTPIGITQQTVKSQYLQEIIIERASLFYYDHPKDEVKNNEEWLRRLKVREINYVETSYELNFNEIKKNNNTTILQDEWADSWTLYITSESDSLDISKHIVKNIYESHSWKDVSYINMILTTSLSSLKEMGFPVERILQRPI